LLKGPSHRIIFAWKWYGSIGLGKDCDAGFKKINLLNFVLADEVLVELALNTSNYLFLGNWLTLAGIEFSLISYQL
jgi:hypothetical protein